MIIYRYSVQESKIVLESRSVIRMTPHGYQTSDGWVSYQGWSTDTNSAIDLFLQGQLELLEHVKRMTQDIRTSISLVETLL